MERILLGDYIEDLEQLSITLKIQIQIEGSQSIYYIALSESKKCLKDP